MKLEGQEAHCTDPDCTCQADFVLADPHKTNLICGMGMAVAESVHDSTPAIYWHIKAQRLPEHIDASKASDDDFVIENYSFVIEPDALIQCVARMHSELGPDFSRAVMLAMPRSPEMQEKYEDLARKIDELIPDPE